jgi:long-chain acyl-CoA synthetase
MARLIPIDPATHLTEAMQATSYVLRHERIVCIFPEGRRSISEEVQDFKKGIGILAKELDIPIVPVYIAGSHYAWPRTSRLPRPYPLKIIFGRPLNWRDLGSDYESIARGLREEVLKLQKELTKPAI